MAARTFSPCVSLGPLDLDVHNTDRDVSTPDVQPTVQEFHLRVSTFMNKANAACAAALDADLVDLWQYLKGVRGPLDDAFRQSIIDAILIALHRQIFSLADILLQLFMPSFIKPSDLIHSRLGFTPWHVISPFTPPTLIGQFDKSQINMRDICDCTPLQRVCMKSYLVQPGKFSDAVYSQGIPDEKVGLVSFRVWTTLSPTMIVHADPLLVQLNTQDLRTLDDNVTVVKLMLAMGANPNDRMDAVHTSLTILSMVIRCGSIACLQALIEAKADTNAIVKTAFPGNEKSNNQTIYFEMPLVFFAALFRRMDMLLVLDKPNLAETLKQRTGTVQTGSSVRTNLFFDNLIYFRDMDSIFFYVLIKHTELWSVRLLLFAIQHSREDLVCLLLLAAPHRARETLVLPNRTVSPMEEFLRFMPSMPTKSSAAILHLLHQNGADHTLPFTEPIAGHETLDGLLSSRKPWSVPDILKRKHSTVSRLSDYAKKHAIKRFRSASTTQLERAALVTTLQRNNDCTIDTL